jgi:group I intron endonuclease
VKESHGCIYLLTNLINGKRYVGQHKNVLTVARRWKRHVTVAITTNDERPLYRAIRKAWKRDRRSLDGFRAEVIWSGAADVKRLNAKETYYVKKLHSFIDDPKGDRSYNLTKGGGQPVRSKQSKEKLTAAMAKRWARSTERAQHSAALKLKWSNKEWAVLNRAAHRTISYRAGLVKSAKRWHADPEKHARQQAAANQSPEAQKKRSKTLAAWYADTKNHTKHLKTHRTKEFRAKRSKIANAQWPKTSEERKAYWRCTHPNGNGHGQLTK